MRVPLRRIVLASFVALSLLVKGCGCDDDDDDSGGRAPSAGGGGPPPVSAVADLDVDTDRDGVVDDAADETGEDAWSALGGAVYYFNLDDDDNDDGEDHLDGAVNGTADGQDLARVLVRHFPDAPAGGTATILVSAGAQGRVRLFRNAGGAWSSVYSGGASFTIPIADVIAGQVELGIEARDRVSPSWDGRVTLTLEIRDASNALVGSDAVLLRSAPWLMSTNLWPAEELCVVNVSASPNAPFRSALSAACGSAGVSYVEIPGSSYSQDRWVQDSHETGAVYLPVAGAPRRRADHVLQCARWREVDAWCRSGLFGPDFDLLARFSTNTSSLNYGGNLEITGPFTSPAGIAFPWGRILVGGGTSAPVGGGAPVTRRMVQAYRDYLNALDIQGPYLEVSTEWLTVGHVDEHTMLIPAPALPRGWALLLASPALARQRLQAVQTAGGGGLAVFAGRSGWQTSVDAILADSSLMTYNDEVQSRMDAFRALYRTELGLADAEIIDVPALYEPNGSGAAAYTPAVVNLVVLRGTGATTHLVIPDPEGPDQPADVWQAETTLRLHALFTGANPVSITYADVFFSYHTLLGEAHCGINTVRTPPAADWWDD